MDQVLPSLEALRNTPFVLSILAVATFGIVRYAQSPWRSIPPGPKGIPLFGNVFQLGQEPWNIFKRWGQEYGPLIYLNVVGQPLIVINSQKVAIDLLDRRAVKYSDRPRNIVASDFMTGGLFLVLMPYNEIWRRMRKATHEGMTKSAVARFQPAQYGESLTLVSDILAHPESWDAHLRRASASTSMSMVYDTPPIKSENDPAVKRINNCVARLMRAAAPGAHLVELIPWLRHIPSRFASWKREALAWFTRDSAAFEELFNDVRDRHAAGDDRLSLAAMLIEESWRNGLSERENAWLSATVYAGGAETTSGVMAWWMLAMVAYPETQRRGQAEVGAVVGRSRLPTFADLEHLPYVRAMVKEALRWQPVNRVGVPYRSTKDDWYDGYFIPVGSVVIPNVWHLNREPEVYGADAAEYNPSRYLNADGQVVPGPVDAKEDGHVSYGFGRRICVGRHFANNALFMNIAMMLWAVNIEQGVDEKGALLPFDVEGCIDNGLVARPILFECKITPRFPETVSILEQERDLAKY
ncbi:cytochrome P450 [Dentipellis sp. KUC8613]|nr:cytochrome P450 [Dentipellis sp. KUC8613]